jgi:coenzyme A diphosphatase NUDT7
MGEKYLPKSEKVLYNTYMNFEKLSKLLYQNTTTIKTDKKESAVIIPILKQSNDWVIVFEKKPAYDRLHPGQISFPGGSKEKKDKTFLETAIRETCEEIGVCKNDLTIIGQEQPIYTLTTDFLIYPFAAFIKKQPQYSINRDEVEKLLFVPIEFLIKHPPKLDLYLHKNRQIETLTIEFEGEIIWGATARILKNFIPKLTKAYK